MFARDDVNRSRRFPLLWVFGPLILGGLIVIILGIGARATQGFPNIELGDEIESAAGSGSPLLAELTDFDWDRVCVFPPRLPQEAVDERLGFEWSVVGGDTLTGRHLLVFVRDDEVVTHLFLRRGIVDAPAAEGDCRGPTDESTRL